MWRESNRFDVPGLIKDLNIGQKQNTTNPASLLQGLASLSGSQTQPLAQAPRRATPDYSGMAMQQSPQARTGEQQQEEEKKHVQAALNELVQARKAAETDFLLPVERMTILTKHLPYNVAQKVDNWVSGEQTKRGKSSEDAWGKEQHGLIQSGEKTEGDYNPAQWAELGFKSTPPAKSAKGMSTSEQWKQTVKLMEIEKNILDPMLLDDPGMQPNIDFFNQYTKKPYRYQRTAGTPGEETGYFDLKLDKDPTPSTIEKIDISGWEKTRIQNPTTGDTIDGYKTPGGFRDLSGNIVSDKKKAPKAEGITEDATEADVASREDMTKGNPEAEEIYSQMVFTGKSAAEGKIDREKAKKEVLDIVSQLHIGAEDWKATGRLYKDIGSFIWDSWKSFSNDLLQGQEESREALSQ